MEAILAYRLTEKNLTSMEIGFFFAIFPVFYIISCTIIGSYLSKKIDKRVVMIIATLCNSAAFTLVGPSLLLSYPDSITLMCIGQAAVGLCFGGMFVPALPASIEFAKENFPGYEREVNSRSTGLFFTFLGIGFLVAPLYGSILN